MKFEKDQVVFETTGRREYCYGESLSCHPSSPQQLEYGSDGALPAQYSSKPLTAVERKEAAQFIIYQAIRWLQAGTY